MADSLQEAVADLAKVKAEHRGILRTLASDAGMAPETRATLIDHLYDEEDEHLAEIQAMSQGAPAASAAAAAAQSGRASQRSLTVGSLRSNEPPRTPNLGSLRPH